MVFEYRNPGHPGGTCDISQNGRRCGHPPFNHGRGLSGPAVAVGWLKGGGEFDRTRCPYRGGLGAPWELSPGSPHDRLRCLLGRTEICDIAAAGRCSRVTPSAFLPFLLFEAGPPGSPPLVAQRLLSRRLRSVWVSLQDPRCMLAEMSSPIWSATGGVPPFYLMSGSPFRQTAGSPQIGHRICLCLLPLPSRSLIPGHPSQLRILSRPGHPYTPIPGHPPGLSAPPLSFSLPGHPRRSRDRIGTPSLFVTLKSATPPFWGNRSYTGQSYAILTPSSETTSTPPAGPSPLPLAPHGHVTLQPRQRGILRCVRDLTNRLSHTKRSSRGDHKSHRTAACED